MNPISYLILAAIAAWRISYMLVHEDGPLYVFDALRRQANRTPLAPLFACVYCMSVWIAVILYLGRSSAFIEGVQYIAVISAGAIAFHKLHNVLVKLANEDVTT